MVARGGKTSPPHGDHHHGADGVADAVGEGEAFDIGGADGEGGVEEVVHPGEEVVLGGRGVAVEHDDGSRGVLDGGIGSEAADIGGGAAEEDGGVAWVGAGDAIDERELVRGFDFDPEGVAGVDASVAEECAGGEGIEEVGALGRSGKACLACASGSLGVGIREGVGGFFARGEDDVAAIAFAAAGAGAVAGVALLGECGVAFGAEGGQEEGVEGEFIAGVEAVGGLLGVESIGFGAEGGGGGGAEIGKGIGNRQWAMAEEWRGGAWIGEAPFHATDEDDC